ncbi:G-protein alpha subunit, putative [Trichomonas vaginalis G3]|uniref:G-protein alpha subunit, putative n=1 Tax=Trichomonas vaginalis (strain ATCC PRA-98 / G3) TaxID=412133 RepID=A2EB65_TRIV3|nr:G-protein beta/gamma-subunit complex binding [Trichomonas vaginalis G3]EAY10111.1 G-protein alpha subunit, putative [Trichomonas vaginalis G3]KAI5531514.1 G-protein beta/gamma-subunit complex binding [Trichomonas vaginalis G3]|eukprot:XP_001322334.1 G-protein alpha subunit [Trichomonas vaginalis G3]
MGCGASSAEDTTKQAEQPAQEKPKAAEPKEDGIPIKKSNAEAKEKILTLGAGECGKTTLWRQLKITYCGGFTDSERRNLINALRTAIVGDIQLLVSTAENSNQNFLTEIQSDIDCIKNLDVAQPDDFTTESAESIAKVWADPAIKNVYKASNSIGIGENADYFLDNVKRIADPSYTPTNDDILKARIRTVGISNLTFDVKGIPTNLVDVGGQRNERKNWSKCFQNVTYVMFVVSLSDFDQTLFEDESTTRTADSIELFKNIASTPIFESTPFFLVLNKFDLFQKKIKKSPEAFNSAYPGFTGDINNKDDCINHIKETFINHLPPNRSPDAWIEAIPTCAMDSQSVRNLFQRIAQKIVEKYPSA